MAAGVRFQSRATENFWSLFKHLSPPTQRLAIKAFRTWSRNPGHPSLHFKRVHASKPVYSVRIGQRWRAMGVVTGQDVLWFWIGTHADYDRLLTNL